MAQRRLLQLRPTNNSCLPPSKTLKAVNAELRNDYSERLEELITLLPVTEDQLVSELKRNNTHLYLSDEPNRLKVQEALNEGVAAAIMSTPKKDMPVFENQLRVAFDGDAVLFSNEFQGVGLKAFLKNEKQNVEKPMKKGPFKGFLEVLIKLQPKLHNKGKKCPIRTYLVTSRGAGCPGYRALNTLRTWGLELDEAVFVGGADKGPTLQRIKPHIFFDAWWKTQSELAGLLKGRPNIIWSFEPEPNKWLSTEEGETARPQSASTQDVWDA
ncbi:cytosolic 5'-nucleotidase 1A-like [Pelmatolapia mariae]|uniref:cytosolic 5'-nucleotidase 1A-like n=1 Tax=Pelmatolapia mariae TaxID=158779 RepID=UPI002FE547F9